MVPLRADTGWAEKFDTDPVACLDTLQTLDHVSAREQCLPADQRTVWKGLLRPFPVTDDTGTHHDLRVAYIWSSEEAASVAEARERGLAKATDALTRVRIEALVATVGIALLIFGLIEADLHHTLGDGVALPGLLPEHRAAIPTSRAVLAAFAGLHLTYTPRPGTRPTHHRSAEGPSGRPSPTALSVRCVSAR